MRSRAFVLGAAACGALAGLVLHGHRAAALSCADHPDGSPRAIAAGDESLSTGDRFLERYDFAVLGTVTHIDTVREGGPDHGATTVTMDVTAVLGRREAPDTLALSSPDPGGLAGYPYRVGTGYFIPVQARGPGGERNYTFLCDPITEVDDVDALADGLAPLAADAGITFAVATEASLERSSGQDVDETVERQATASASQATDRAPVLLVGLASAALGLAGGGFYMHARRRRRHGS
ncbi:MAG: hypothetical protein ACLFXM_00380 [Acidimicrobiia bacterium]